MTKYLNAKHFNVMRIKKTKAKSLQMNDVITYPIDHYALYKPSDQESNLAVRVIRHPVKELDGEYYKIPTSAGDWYLASDAEIGRIVWSSS